MADDSTDKQAEAQGAAADNAAASKQAVAKDAAQEIAPKDAVAQDAAQKSAATPAQSEGSEAASQEGTEKAPARSGDRTATDDIFAEISGESAEQKVKIHKAKGSKNVSRGIVHVSATFNNTLVSVSDPQGNVIGWASAGKLGFKGSRKSTAYAAQEVSKDACRQAMGHGLKEVDVQVKGPGSGRESAVRAVQALGIDILSIADVTPVPHNGCRPPKARRV